MIVSAPDTPNVCPTCDDTGLVAPLGGRGSDGPDPCPHCTPAAGSSSPDVAALAERLRDDGLQARHHDEVLTADDACRWGGVGALLWAEDMFKAADALEAQAARITELEADNRRLATTMTGDTATDLRVLYAYELGLADHTLTTPTEETP